MLLGMHDAEAVHHNQFFVDWSGKLWRLTLRYTALVSAPLALEICPVHPDQYGALP